MNGASSQGERRSPFRGIAGSSSPSWRRLLVLAFLLTVALVAGRLAILYLRVVLTPSIPRGLYLERRPRNPLHVGALVSFCPERGIALILVRNDLEPRGHCEGGSIPLAKRVLALSPDLCGSSLGLEVDRHLLPWPRIPDYLRLPHLRYCGPTPPDCLFLVGDSPDSIDSRIFGCVPRRSITGELEPLLVEHLP